MSRDALVIGINQYICLNPLRTPSVDAEAIAQLLEKQGDFDVIHRFPSMIKEGQRCIDPDPPSDAVSIEQLEIAIQNLFNPEGEQIPEMALLFFAGHGLRENRGGIYYGYLASTESNSTRRLWGIDLRWLRELLQKSPVKQQIIWLDCCHAGEIIKLEDANPGNRGEDFRQCFIAATREYDAAYEEITGKHGVLTAALLAGLDPSQSPTGKVDNLSLCQFIEQKLKGTTQKPVFTNFGSEPIILTTMNEIESPISPSPLGICPYKGLQFFDFNDEDPKYFHGRENLTDELIAKVQSGNFLAVLGVSGSGKSSVVRAGLLHQLKLGAKLGESGQWRIYKPFSPAENNRTPLENLAQVLVTDNLPTATRLKELDSIDHLLQQGASGLKRLIDAIEAPRIVLVIDQFEEFFTRCQPTERQQFFECVLGCLPPVEKRHEISKLCVVITMRADFLGKCAEQDYAGLTRYIDAHQITVTPMKQSELEVAITVPAKQVGLKIEPELTAAMLKDVEGPASLPLLEYTLTELWQQHRGDWLTLAEYMRLGGVQNILPQSADRVYQSLSFEQQAVTQWIFLELTQLGEGTEDTRKQVLKKDLVTAQHPVDLIEQVLDKLATARLVVVKALRSRSDKQSLETVIDVAHEALIRYWGKLRQWIDENREFKRWKDTLHKDMQVWEQAGQKKDELLRGIKLLQSEEQCKKHTDKLHKNDLEFIQASVNLRQHEQDEEQRRQEEREQLLQKAQQEAQRAKKQAQIALIEKLGAQSILATQLPSASNGYYEQALILAIQAFKEKNIITSRSNLLRVLQAKKQLNGFGIQNPISVLLADHFEDINSVAFSQDGKIIAIAMESFDDNTVELWDIETGKLLGKPLTGHSGSVESVAFSPNNKILASGSSDCTVRLWNVETRKSFGEPLTGHSNSVNSVAFNSDGKMLASGSSDHTIRLWNVETKKPLGEPLTEHSNSVEVVAFNHDGNILASGGYDNTVILWNIEMRTPLGKLDFDIYKINIGINSVSFSPDGKILASGDSKKNVILWDVKTRKLLGEPLAGHSSEVRCVTFSPDGKILASGSYDNNVRLWDVETRQSLGEPLEYHSKFVLSVAFSPDGKTLASGSWDNTVRLWDVNPESWAKKACAIVNRNFSHKEWEKYMGKHRSHEKTCPNLPQDTLGAIELTQQARQLLKEGKTKLAKEKFAKAREWDANVVFGDEGL